MVWCFIPEYGRYDTAIVEKIFTGPKGGKQALLRPLGRPFATSLSSLPKRPPKFNPNATRKCPACGKPTRITTAGCDHCDLEDK